MPINFSRVIVSVLVYCSTNVIIWAKDYNVRFPQAGCAGIPSFINEQEQLKTIQPETDKTLNKTLKIVTTWGSWQRGHTVRISLKADYSKPLCGGIIQNALYIITAAHCLDQLEPYKLIITAGWRTHIAQNRSVVSFTIHNDWDQKTFVNDIAILKLNDSLKLSVGQVFPEPIGQPDLVNASIYESWITGWGLQKFWPNENLVYSQTAAHSPAPLVDLQLCNKIYIKLGKTISKNQICAGGIKDCGPCTGDDGGPLTVIVKYNTGVYQRYVIGLLSTYEGCATGVPDIYTNLESYKAWIQLTTGRQCDFNIYAVDIAKGTKKHNLNKLQKPKGQIQKSVAIAICVSFYKFVHTLKIQAPLDSSSMLQNLTLASKVLDNELFDLQVTSNAIFCTNLLWNVCDGCEKFDHVKCQSTYQNLFNVKSTNQLRPRVMGGHDAKPHQHPYQVRISTSYDGRSNPAACSGVIYNSLYILTSARCVHILHGKIHLPCVLTVVAGDHSVSLKEETEQIRRAVAIIVHEKFVNKPFYDYDIALLKMDVPFNFTVHVHSITLATKDYPNENVDLAELSGWGALGYDNDEPEVLQTVTIPLVDDCDCRLFYSSFNVNAFNSHKICAGSLNHGFCGDNDAGNPLTVIDDEIKYLAGLASFAIHCGIPRSPGYSTKVSAYSDWIKIRAG